MNNIFADNYNKQGLSTQQYFTSTPSQYEDNSYNPNQLLGLGYGDVALFPTLKVGVTGAKALGTITNEVTPKVVKKTRQVYDDTTLGMTGIVERVAPTISNPKNIKIGKEFIDGFQADGVKLPIMKNKAHNTGYGTRVVIEELGN